MLELRDVTVDYLTPAGTKRAVDNVSFALAPGEVLGLAGESGSGKSTIAQAILRILRPPGVISGGEGAARTRTPTGCCVSTSLRAPTCPLGRPKRSRPSLMP